jgi:hypothetical protein
MTLDDLDRKWGGQDNGGFVAADEEDLNAALSLLQDVHKLLEFLTDRDNKLVSMPQKVYKRIDDLEWDIEVFLNDWEFPSAQDAAVDPKKVAK